MALPKIIWIATLLATLTVGTTTDVPWNDTSRKINGGSGILGANDTGNTLNAEGAQKFYTSNTTT